MKYLSFIVTVLMLAACSRGGNKNSDKDTLSTTVADTTKLKSAVSSLCFLKTEGKDSTSIQLVIKGDSVTGEMDWVPYEKDARHGQLHGVMKNDTIAAAWTFMQEGMRDTINLKFKMETNQLTQKPLKVNAKTGREQTDDAAGYTVVYPASNKGKK
ncbi:MAG TPA: hypothetical protein VIM55_08825 [Mucilaginibacter sp.]